MESAEIEELLENIQELQSILIGVATGKYRIQEKDEEYKELSQEIASQIEDFQYEGLQIENPNNFQSLWDWYKHYDKSKLRKGLRAGYIHNLYQDICTQLDLILYTNYIESASPEILNKELEPTRIQEFKSKIEQLQSLMIDVATQSDVTSLIQKKDPEYSKIYQEVGLHIRIIQYQEIPISNPNNFRSLWQWNSFYFDEYAKDARKEYINNLYLDLLKPFDRALKKYSNKPNANQEFIQYIKSRLKPVNNILSDQTLVKADESNKLQTSTINQSNFENELTGNNIQEQLPVPASIITPIEKQKILILAAIPDGLNLSLEIRKIEEAIRRASKRDMFDIRIRTAVRPQDIRRAIGEERPKIVHFCGHGLNDGSLLLEDDGGNNKPVSPQGLATLFKQHNDYVNCVLLNACHSVRTADTISQHINYVIGMNQEINDKAAIAFAEGFYDGLGFENLDRQNVFQRAFDEGVTAIALEDYSQESIPVLKKLEGIKNKT